MAAPNRPRSIVYIDGFNLYNGLAKPLNCKWVDLQLLFERILSQNEVVEVNFFTSMVVGPTASNQAIYLQALRTLPKVRVHFGFFQVRPIQCRAETCTLRPRGSFDRPVEKQTDVAIAVRMIEDAVQERCDNLVLVSGDSDFVPAVNMIRRQFPQVAVSLYVPTLGRAYDELLAQVKGRKPSKSVYAGELRSAVHKHADLPITPFLRSPLPNPVTSGDGEEIRMPASWKTADPRAYQRLISDLQAKLARR